MSTIKTLIIKRFKTLSLLTISMSLSIILLMIRAKLTHSFFFLFLVWNLFLAVIPYVITSYLICNHKTNKFVVVLMLATWLVFIPNAPYIITDFLHLRLSDPHIIWLDVLVVTSFALNGLFLCFLSIIDMESIINTYIKKQPNVISTLILFVLIGFGIYLGRYLRWNSWDILQHPKTILLDITEIIIHPFQHSVAWLFTLGFGTFLTVTYLLFKSILIKEKPILLKENINS